VSESPGPALRSSCLDRTWRRAGPTDGHRPDSLVATGAPLDRLL